MGIAKRREARASNSGLAPCLSVPKARTAPGGTLSHGIGSP